MDNLEDNIYQYDLYKKPFGLSGDKDIDSPTFAKLGVLERKTSPCDRTHRLQRGLALYVASCSRSRALRAFS